MLTIYKCTCHFNFSSTLISDKRLIELFPDTYWKTSETSQYFVNNSHNFHLLHVEHVCEQTEASVMLVEIDLFPKANVETT